MSTPKVIKRYANRKLYDTDRSCYVTLEDIALMIKAGDEVQVVDNKSGEDLTAVTFAQIIFETEKKSGSMPLGLLRDLIENKGGWVSELARDRLGQVQGQVEALRTTAQARVQDVRERLGGGLVDMVKKGEKGVRGQLDQVQKAMDDLQKGVEDRVKGGVGLVGREFEQLRARLRELEERFVRGDSPKQD